MSLPIQRHTFGASSRDADVASLLETVYIGEGYAPPTAAPQFGPGPLGERGVAWVALAGDRVAGTIFLVPATNRFRQVAVGPEREVHLLAVSPAHRGAGVAGALLRTLTEQAIAEGVPMLVLSTQLAMTAAHALYVRNGFVRAPARDWARPDGRPYWVFTKSLST